MDKEQLDRELAASEAALSSELQKVNIQLAFLQGRVEGLKVALGRSDQPLNSKSAPEPAVPPPA